MANWWPDGEEEWWKPKPKVPPIPPQQQQSYGQDLQIDPGYMPDYNSLIFGNPAYLAWKNNSMLDLGQAKAWRKQMLRTLVTRYGGMGKFQDTYGDIDAETLEQAGRNEFSDTKRLQKQYEQGVQNFKQSLAARRGISSGDLQHGLDQRDTQRATGEYDLANQFGDAAQGTINDYLRSEQLIRMQEQDALRNAAWDVYNNPANRPRSGRQAKLDQTATSVMGYPIYVDDEGGRWWMQDGKPQSWDDLWKNWRF